MTFAEIKEHVMFQTNNDADDLPDFLPHLDRYVNEGYTQLCKAWDPDSYSAEVYPPLKEDDSVPLLPEWTHRALGDWATWLVYRNGNPQKQNRGMYFRQAFWDVLTTIRGEGGKNGMNEDGTRKRYNKFRNIPV